MMGPTISCVRWLWFSLIIISITHVSKQNNVEPSNTEIMAAINGLKTVLEAKLNRMDSTLDGFTRELAVIKGNIGSVEVEIEGIGGRSSQSLTASEKTLTEIKNLKQNVSDELKVLNNKVESLEYNVYETVNETSALLQTMMKQETESLKEPLRIIHTAVLSLEANADEVNIFHTNTSELLQEIKNSTDSTKDTISVIETAVLSLEENADEVNIFHTNTSELLQGIKNSTDSVKEPISIIETAVLSLEENADEINIFHTNLQENVKNMSNLLDNLQNDSQSIGTSVKRIVKRIVCPESKGFFMLPGSYQCFRAFTGTVRSWADADAKCKTESLALAELWTWEEPKDALPLQKYLNARFGSGNYWLGGKPSGSSMHWVRGHQSLPSTSTMWYPGHAPSSRPNMHLAMTAYSSNMNSNPGQVYLSHTSSSSYNTLCEVIVE